MHGRYIYYSSVSNLKKEQELTRKDKIQSSDTEMKPDVLMHELKAALIIFYSTLNEKQRRLYAGYESLRIGYGGDKRIGELLDINQKTVAKGRQELLGEKSDINNIREPGGGRKSIKKIPEVIDKIEELMRYETAGDPMSNLKWTKKTTQKIADELSDLDIKVSKTTVDKILRDLGFSLKTNLKKIANGGKTLTKEKREQRNRQFEYIQEIRFNFNKLSIPSISVDTKKKEPVGNFKNSGTRYKREADLAQLCGNQSQTPL